MIKESLSPKGMTLFELYFLSTFWGVRINKLRMIKEDDGLLMKTIIIAPETCSYGAIGNNISRWEESELSFCRLILPPILSKYLFAN